jgi:hypothetical protein
LSLQHDPSHLRNDSLSSMMMHCNGMLTVCHRGLGAV